eukprot:m.110515 g.110515  ORF g.110515 m.110515 type:complete len:254 (+) comp16049_c0_seq1:122-883(+)
MASSEPTSSWERMLQGGCPIAPEERAKMAAEGQTRPGAPPPAGPADSVDTCGQDDGTVNPANQMAIRERQKPAPDQRLPLPTARVTSSIPKADFTPAHQDDGEKWQYPSEQMFYNAMRRKGWDPNEKDMSVVVSMHNAVNEHSWRQVMAWEKLHECDCVDPKLKKFLGRPKDLSPKARLRTLLGYAAPFDRHDWIVDRCGTDVRYVIDFYSAEKKGGGPGFFIDARPAMDSFTSVWDRVRMSFRKALGTGPQE